MPLHPMKRPTIELHQLSLAQLKIGRRVYHEHFGWGRILKVYELNRSRRVEVNFEPPCGSRVLDLSVAKLFAAKNHLTLVT